MKPDLNQLKEGVTASGFRNAPFAALLWTIRRMLWPVIRQYHFFQLEKLVELQQRVGELNELIESTTHKVRELNDAARQQDANLRREIGEQRGSAVSELRDTMAAESNVLRNSLLQQDAKLRQEIEEQKRFVVSELQKCTLSHIELRSDLGALANRQAQVASDVERQGQELGRLAVSAQQNHAQVASLQEESRGGGDERLRTLQAQVGGLHSAVAANDMRDGETAVRMGQLQSAVDAAATRQKLFLVNNDSGIFILKSGDLISEHVAVHGRWDAHLTPILEDVANTRKGIAVDVGAHLGLLTAAMAKYFRRVISFEPNGFNYRLLVANMSLNGLRQVDCQNVPLFSKSTRLSLGNPEDQEIPLSIDANGEFDGLAATNLGAYSFTENGTEIYSCPARTLDSYSLDDVAFIKVDAQGADGEIIRGAIETIQRCRPIVVFEWEKLLSQKYETSIEDVITIFRAVDYDVDVFKVTNEKQCDYLAVPRRPLGEAVSLRMERRRD